MAFVNYRVGTYRSYISFASGRTGEDEFIVTAGLSAGFGVNPNSGTNQPEFFTGLAIGFNRVFIHTGIHWGRSETPGNGFYVGQSVPSGMMLPLNWSYHAKFSIGFSARVAPF